MTHRLEYDVCLLLESLLLLPLQSLTGRRRLSCVCTPLSSCGTAHLPLTRILTDLLLFAWSSRGPVPFGSSAKHLSSLCFVCYGVAPSFIHAC